MASLPPQKCCVTGFKHDGSPTGSEIDISGTKAYITGDKSAGKAVLILPDVIGHTFTNVQLIADTFAEQGYFVLIPDLFNGDARTLNDDRDFVQWRSQHGVEVTEPNVERALKWLKSEVKPKYLAAIGYCFGAKYVVRAAGRPDSGVDVVAVAHPSFVSIEEVAALKKPLLISGAEVDGIYTPELRKQTEEKLKEIKATYFTTETSGVSHGFSVRGDPNDFWQRTAKEKVLADQLWWFSLFQ